VPLLERKTMSASAGGAEHVHSVTAGIEQKARELAGAGGVRRAVLIDRGCDGGNDAGEFFLLP
jgi:hypothetical protein